MSATIYEAPRMAPKPGETVITTTCGHNCGGRCVVNAHVKGGRIIHISTDMRRWNPTHPPLPACARGVGQIERTYHPDRLQYPMRRVGPRGSGQFERVTWDEALDQVAHEMKRVRATYGNAAILDASRTGSLSMLHGRSAALRFLHMFGGCTNLWSSMSNEAEIFAVHMTYGADAEAKSSGREPTDYVNSKLILMWGWSPGDGTFGTGTMPYLKWAKRNGTRIVCVDPGGSRAAPAATSPMLSVAVGTGRANRRLENRVQISRERALFPPQRRPATAQTRRVRHQCAVTVAKAAGSLIRSWPSGRIARPSGECRLNPVLVMVAMLLEMTSTFVC